MLQYRIEPKDPHAHLFEVTLTVPMPDRTGQGFSMPAWIPGSYLVRDFAKHVVSLHATCDGEPIGITKIDKSTWQADACHGPLTVVAEIYAHDLSVRGAHLDTTHAYFNGPCMFLCVMGQDDVACEVDIVAPPAPLGQDWRVATSMPPKDAPRYGYGTYTASDYADLIDHPVEIGDLQIGEFEVAGIPHAIAVQGRARVDLGRVCRDLTTVCEMHQALLGAPSNLDRYLFLLQVLESGYGGLEHRWSSSLISSRHDLPRRGQEGMTRKYRKFLGLCSHEYFHLWNVTRMKPAAFTPHRLDAERYTGLLWVFEGITSYYDDLALVRSGLITETSYLELLGETLTRVLRSRGRERQSVEESSFDAWTKFYKQDAGSPNFIVSYYAKGALVACALDLTLRRITHGNVTLDAVMRECWQRYGDTGRGMPERGLESVANEMCGVSLDDFFERYVRGTADLPLERLLGGCGILLRRRAAQGSDDKGGTPAKGDKPSPPSIGATFSVSKGRAVFRNVVTGGAAERAGAAPGDEPVALDNLKLTSRNVYKRLADYRSGETVALTVFRNDELLRLEITLDEPPLDTCYLVVDEDAGDEAVQNRAAWLSK